VERSRRSRASATRRYDGEMPENDSLLGTAHMLLHVFEKKTGMHRQQRHIVAGSFWLSALDYTP